MASQEYLDLLRQGTQVWNQWRQEHPEIQPDLSEADLRGFFNLGKANLSGVNLLEADLRNIDLREADLSSANLRGANLSRADLRLANLSEAKLRDADLNSSYLNGAYLRGADLSNAYLVAVQLKDADLRESDFNLAILHGAYLSNANLRKASLTEAHLMGADLSGADLTGADLSGANLSEVNLSRANLTGCLVYAASVWNVRLDDTIQSGLQITPYTEAFIGEAIITVDDLEVAQFIYLLLNNKRIRGIIDTITSKVVLILGRFTPKRKAVLNALRDELRKHNYTPVMFDFEKPASRDLTETVSILAHLARFVIVDLTDPSSAPHEVATVIPQTVVPVQPLLLREPLMVDGKAVERREYAMFEDLRRRYHWVLPTFCYQDTAELLTSLQAHIIAPAEQKVRELTQPK